MLVRIHSQAYLLREREVRFLLELLIEFLRSAPFGRAVLLAVTGIAPAPEIEEYSEGVQSDEDQYALQAVFAPNDMKR